MEFMRWVSGTRQHASEKVGYYLRDLFVFSLFLLVLDISIFKSHHSSFYSIESKLSWILSKFWDLNFYYFSNLDSKEIVKVILIHSV